MKTHTNDFKNEIKKFGRQIDSKITYTINSEEIELGKEQLNSITPHYEGNILKSVMKQLDIDSNVEIPLNTIINYKFGVLVNNAYEYVDYGNYVVYKVEKQEDTNSYKITCYDKMLYSMVEYESLGVTYPITIREYLSAICTKLGLTFKNASDTFPNYDKQILSELYLDSEGNSLDYTFRDVLDEIAGATGSTICINEDTDELEVRYVSNTGTQTTVEGTSISIENSDDEKIDLTLQGNTTQSGTPTPTTPVGVETVTGGQNILVCGKNLFDKNTITTGKRIDPQGYQYTDANYSLSDYIVVEPNTTYIRNLEPSAYQCVALYRSDKTFISRSTSYQYFTTTSDTYYIRFSMANENVNTTQLEKGNQITTYEAYNGTTYGINLGKNLFDKNNANVIKGYINAGAKIQVNATGEDRIIYISCQPSTTYTLQKMLSGTTSKNRFRVGTSETTPVHNLIVNQFYNAGDGSTITNYTITTTATTQYLIFYCYTEDTETTFDDMLGSIQIEKGSVATTYTPYKTPIELCKINDYKDRMFRVSGKNLIDADTLIPAMINSQSYSSTAVVYDSETKVLTMTNPNADTFIPLIYNNANNIPGANISVKPNTTYTLHFEIDQPSSTWKNCVMGLNKSTNKYNYITSLTTVNTMTFNTGEYDTITFRVGSTASTGTTTHFSNFQLEEGSTATTYEPYGEKGTWYIEKQIGKVVLNGSENWLLRSDVSQASGYYTFRNGSYVAGQLITNGTGYSNYFEIVSSGVSNRNNIRLIDTRGYGTQICIDGTIAQTKEALQTWLSTHNTIVYYVLATPTYTEITDSELIGQLNSVKLMEGLNNVSVSSADLGSPIKITYTSELDTIDEEYLKDINVNFGEKFGKVNSIVLSRSAESDNIYLRDEESVLENGLCEIKIKDNQIMNNNDRYQFLPGLLEALDGLEYYINDFASPGIMYYNLCDKYKVKVGDNYYKCILFNDEVNVTQGLEENIFTEMPEETETDYTKSDKTDIRERQSYIIVDKQNARIDSVVQSVSTLNTRVDNQDGQILTLGTRLTQTETELTATITSLEEDGVSKVKNTIATLDDTGLSISTDTSKIKTTMTNNEFKITDSGGTSLAHFGYDEEEGISVARMDNITVENYLTTGNHRIEDYTEDGEERTGFFYIGG